MSLLPFLFRHASRNSERGARRGRLRWWLLGLAGLVGGCLVWERTSRPEPELFLIPEGYRGPVRLIFGQAGGAWPEYEAGRRLYRIPATGILFTQFTAKPGLIDQQYYYVSPAGERRRLGVLDSRDFNEPWTTEHSAHEPSRDSVAVFNPGTMGSSSSSANPDATIFEELRVGSYRDLQRIPNFSLAYLDSLQQAVHQQAHAQ